MKTILLISFVLFILTSLSFGQPISIADVQDTTGGAGGGESRFMGEVVTVHGTVSAESWAYGNGWYCIQDGSGPWSGIYVWEDPNRENAYGDSVQVTGTVDEWSGLTYIWASNYVKLDSGKTVEPTFGIIKHVLGFRQFLVRGIEQVSGEWELVCLAYNVKRLFRLKAA